MLIQVSPDAAIHDVPNRTDTDAKLVRHRGKHAMSWCVSLADLAHLFASQFGSALTFTMRKPALSSSVLSVLFVCPEEQVIWPDATPIIARMTNQHSAWNGATSHFIGQAMSKPARRMISSEQTVAASIASAQPKPAITGLVNLRPEPLSESSVSLRCISWHSADLLIAPFLLRTNIRKAGDK